MNRSSIARLVQASIAVAVISGCDKDSAAPVEEPPCSGASCSQPVDSSSTVGYVGCSLTLAAVEGYTSLGGTSLWPVADVGGTYPGGSVYAWYQNLVYPGGPRDRWATFEAALAKYGQTNRIWWHLCPPGSTYDVLPTYDETLAVLNGIKADTSVDIYASVTPTMPLAPNTTAYDVENGYLQTMVSQGLVKKGPVLTPLTESQVAADGHPNQEGGAVWGQDVMDFFDARISKL